MYGGGGGDGGGTPAHEIEICTDRIIDLKTYYVLRTHSPISRRTGTALFAYT
jgi:hypothetical protein